MRVDRHYERIFLRERRDLAIMVGTYIGSNLYGYFSVNVQELSMDVPLSELYIAHNSGVYFRFTVGDEFSPSPKLPPPPPPF